MEAARDTAVMAATPAVAGLFAPGVQAAQEASSILGPEGKPIIKEVLKETPSAAGKVASGVVNAAKGTLDWVNKNPFKAYLLYKLAEEIGLSPTKYKKLIGVVSESE